MRASLFYRYITDNGRIVSTLTKPQARIPVGEVVINGRAAPVMINIEWDRYLSILTERAGGVAGISTTDVDAGSFAAMQPFVQEASYGDVLQLIASANDCGGEVLQGADFGGQFADVMQLDTVQLTDYLPFQE